MSTNELTPEKRIADDPPTSEDLPVFDHPPVPSPETLEFPEPTAIYAEPPRTRLLLEGFDPGEITADFLVGIHDLADDHGLCVESISVRHRERDG